MAKKKFKNPAALFCTDYLFVMEDELDGSEAWDVVVAVLNKVFNGVEPVFPRKYLYRYYEDLLYATQEAYDKYMRKDGRSITSAENGKKGGRPPKNDESEEYNCPARKAQWERHKTLVYERIVKEPFKFNDGAKWEDICYYFNDIVEYPDRLRIALQTLDEEGKIDFNSEGVTKYIKLKIV